MFIGAALITSSIYDYCVIRQKELSRKVIVSKVESVYWSKFSSKSFSFNWSGFLICVLFYLLRWAALITSSIYNYCVLIQKEFSRKVGMNYVESFYWSKFSSKSFSFNWSGFLICVLFYLLRWAALITSSIYNYCVLIQKEFSRKVGMNYVESFYWNKLSSKNCSFESEQIFDLCFVLVVQVGCTDNIQYIQLLYSNTKRIL